MEDMDHFRENGLTHPNMMTIKDFKVILQHKK